MVKKVKKQVGGLIPRAGGNLAGAQRPLGGAVLPGARPMIKKGGKIKAKHGGKIKKK